MICLNELIDQKCNDKNVISDFLILLSPYAPHISEEIWSELANPESITLSSFPKFDSKYLVEKEISYPVSFNGKMRFKIDLPTDMQKNDIEKLVMNHEKTRTYLKEAEPKRIIIVLNKIINIVF